MHAACHKPETYWVSRLPFILLLHKLNPKLAVSRKTRDREHARRGTHNILKPRLSKSPTAGSRVKVSCTQPCWIWCFLSLLRFLLGNYLEDAPGLSTVHRLFARKQRQDHKINKQNSQGRGPYTQGERHSWLKRKVQLSDLSWWLINTGAVSTWLASYLPTRMGTGTSSRRLEIGKWVWIPSWEIKT